MNNNDPNRPVTGYPANPNGYSSGTANPYAAGPPPNNSYYAPNPYYQGDDPYADQRRAFLRRVFSILIACVLVTGIVLLIIWLILRPRVPEFRVDSVTVSNFNLSGNLISGNWDVQFSVRNPNKKITIYYDYIESSVFYKSDSLSTTTMPPFSQGRKTQTTVKATFAALSSYVDGSVASRINGDRSRGSVHFSVRLLARARFKAGVWGNRRRYVRVLCRDLPVGIPLLTGRGTLNGGSRQCRVSL